MRGLQRVQRLSFRWLNMQIHDALVAIAVQPSSQGPLLPVPWATGGLVGAPYN